MRRLIAVGAILLLGGCGAMPGSAIVPAAQPVRVMTYNIHAGKDAQQIANLPRVAAVIDSVAADIVLLQEVDRRTQRAGGADHFEELKSLTGMSGFYGKSIAFQGGDYGIAVLSRWPLDSVAALSLAVDRPQEAAPPYEPRIALHVRVHTPAGPIHVVNTHLDARGSGLYRRQELIAMLAHLRATLPAGLPLALGGDLNARPATTDIEALSFVFKDAFEACGSGDGATFPAQAPDRRIDYVFFREARCQAARVVQSQASDHRPFVAILEIAGGK